MIIIRRVLGAALLGSRALATVAGDVDGGLHAAVDAGNREWVTHPVTRGPRAARAVLSDAARLLDLNNVPVRRTRLADALAAFLREAGPGRSAARWPSGIPSG